MTQAMAIGTQAASARPVGRGLLRGLVRRLLRLALMVLGACLVLLGILIAPLPGPFGLPISVVGMVVILRNSYWAKRQFIRAQHARPKFFYPFRRLMRRRPEFAPVIWQQALRMERLLLKRGRRVLSRTRRSFRASFRRNATA
jgi:hypothetical protein